MLNIPLPSSLLLDDISLNKFTISPLIKVVIVMVIRVNQLVKNVTSSLDEPVLKSRSCAFGKIASANTLTDTKNIPIGWKIGVSLQSSTVNTINPKDMENAHAYSKGENIRLFINVAIIMVGMSLQDRNMTFVGKLMKFKDRLDKAEDVMRHSVRTKYDLTGAFIPFSLVMNFLST